MSIARFFVENGIDPTDPYQMDEFMRRHREDLWFGHEDDDTEEEEEENPPLVGYILSPFLCEVITPALNEASLDALADRHGYSKLDASASTAPMASYRRGACRLNFWLTTGTVGSYLQHPRRGKTQLFRRDVKLAEAETIFENPRIHTGKGYEYNNRRTNGKSRGPCRYGQRCYRSNCWFDH